MSVDDLAENLRLLCSYGRSASDICRRAGVNRQQFNKYLNGHSRPSLPTLRRLCDFFGLDDHEILLDADRFRELIKLRPPRFRNNPNTLERELERLIKSTPASRLLLEQHEGYYHIYVCPDPARRYFLRSLGRIYQEDGHWFSKSIDRQLDDLFMLPSTLKYTGVVLECFNQIVVFERERGSGRSIFTTYLYGSEYQYLNYLPGLMMNAMSDGAHHIYCIRVVWHYLGKNPNLRDALGQCGVINSEKETLADFIIECTDNRMLEGESILMPRA